MSSDTDESWKKSPKKSRVNFAGEDENDVVEINQKKKVAFDADETTEETTEETTGGLKNYQVLQYFNLSNQVFQSLVSRIKYRNRRSKLCQVTSSKTNWFAFSEN